MIKQAIIKRLPNGKWQVQSESGKNLGTYTSRGAAEDRLKDIEMFKNMRKRKKSSSEAVRQLICLCQDLKLAGEHEMADKISCALSALAKTKHPRHDLSYSYVMRELRQNYPDKVNEFQTVFKKSFDESIYDDLDEPEQIALMAALQAIDVDIA